MSSLVLEIEDLTLEAGQRAYIDRVATYFLLMVGSDVDVEWYSKSNRIGGAVGLQGGDAVGPLSQAYDRVVLTSATSQTIKVATSSDPVTITRLSGVVQVDGVVQTASDYSRSIRGEAYQAYLETGPVTGEYGILQFENPADSGKNWVIQSTNNGNISFAHGVLMPAVGSDDTYGYTANKLVGAPKPYINLYKGTQVESLPGSARTHAPIGPEDNPIIVPPGEVLTSVDSQSGSTHTMTLNFFVVDA